LAALHYLPKDEQTEKVCKPGVDFINQNDVTTITDSPNLEAKYKKLKMFCKNLEATCKELTEKYNSLVCKKNHTHFVCSTDDFLRLVRTGSFKMLFAIDTFSLDDEGVDALLNAPLFPNELKHIIDNLVDPDMLIRKVFLTDQYPVIEKIIMECKMDLNIPIKKGRTALHYACKYNGIEQVERLINYGVNLDGYDDYGITPLHYAFMYKNIDILQMLINCGANVDNKTLLSGCTVIHLMDKNSVSAKLYDKVLPTILSHSKDETALLEACDNLGYTALQYATILFDTHMIKLLLKNGANPNSPKSSNCNPAQIVCNGQLMDRDSDDRLAVLELLNQYGFDKDCKDSDGRNLIHLTCMSNQLMLTNELIDWAIDKDAVDNSGKKPVHYAIENNNIDLIRALI
jgi:ankyrin repeat protein